jgi:hypothetical protein
MAQEMLAQVLQTREGLRYNRQRPWWESSSSALSSKDADSDLVVVLDGGAPEALATTPMAATVAAPVSTQRQQDGRRGRVGRVESALCLPVLDEQGRVVAVVAVVNRSLEEDDHHTHRDDVGSSGRGFGREDATALAGLCAQASEALTNLTRRPEEHVSLGENLGLLAAHSALPLREYRPSLKALMGAEAAEAEAKAAAAGVLVPTAPLFPRPLNMLPTIAAAAVVPARAHAPAARAQSGEAP